MVVHWLTQRLRFSGFTLDSLRTQLLLWIALPVAVSLLGISLLEIRGHEQAMGRLVRKQTELLAQSTGGLIGAHVDRRQGMLLGLAGNWPAKRSLPDVYAAVFAGGLAFYDGDGRPVVTEQPPFWRTAPAVQTLVQQVLERNTPGMTTVESGDGAGWLLVQAVPVAGISLSRSAAVLAAAVPVQDLAAANLLTPLGLDAVTEIRLESQDGRTMVVWGKLSSDGKASDKVAVAQASVAPTGWLVVVREDLDKPGAAALAFWQCHDPDWGLCRCDLGAFGLLRIAAHCVALAQAGYGCE